MGAWRQLSSNREKCHWQRSFDNYLIMKYRKFGKLGLEVSALGFGAMRLPVILADPSDPKSKSSVDDPEAIRLIRRAIDQGLNYVDTAYGYHGGDSERVVGLALQDGYRDKTFLATKFPCWEWKQPGDFERILDKQLQRLRTDYLDFYMLHALGAQSWNDIILKNGLLDNLLKAKQSGKVRHMGFSFHDSLDAFKQIVDYTDQWDFCQIQLNYIDTEYQAGLAGLRYASSKGLAVIVMEPLHGGDLANVSPDVAAIFAGTGKTPVEWALDYIWNMPEVALLLSGMGSQQMVDDNLVYADRSAVGMLSPADRGVISKAQQILLGQNTIPCTGCEYCMPCPFGVAIPYNFQTYNNLKKGKTLAECQAQYTNWVTMFGKQASACVACGACEKKCPQHIKIADQMKEVAATLG